VWKLILYYIFLSVGGGMIGFTPEAIKSGLDGLIASTDAHKGILLAITAISSCSMIAGIIGSRAE
jgi:hypothetical protein